MYLFPFVVQLNILNIQISCIAKKVTNQFDVNCEGLFNKEILKYFYLILALGNL